MKRLTVLAMLAALALAGCGADGEPVQPTMNLGVGVGSGGVNTWGGVGLNQGPFSVFVGL